MYFQVYHDYLSLKSRLVDETDFYDVIRLASLSYTFTMSDPVPTLSDAYVWWRHDAHAPAAYFLETLFMFFQRTGKYFTGKVHFIHALLLIENNSINPHILQLFTTKN